MRIVVTGATGNVGTSVLRSLIADDSVESIVGIARRVPAWRPRKVEWAGADVTCDALEPHLAGADAVIHLAWAIQPSRDESRTRAVNVDGSRRVFAAAAAGGVAAVVHASSIGAYSPGSQSGGGSMRAGRRAGSPRPSTHATRRRSKGRSRPSRPRIPRSGWSVSVPH